MKNMKQQQKMAQAKLGAHRDDATATTLFADSTFDDTVLPFVVVH